MARRSDTAATSAAPWDLKAILRERFSQLTQKQPLTNESYIRASSLASLCPREEVLVSAEKLVRPDEVTSDLNLIFAHGHGLHYALQNIVLPPTGVIRGQWRCQSCAHLHGAVSEGVLPIQAAIARPTVCGVGDCLGNEFHFVEYDLVDHELRLTGHSDGFLALDDEDGLGILEGKSINSNGAWEVRSCPKMDHVIQTQLYMHLTGAQWGKIVYWDKGGFGLGAIIEHHIERDEETIEAFKSEIRAIWDGVRSGKLPPRICETDDCKRASACSVGKLCFERDA